MQYFSRSDLKTTRGESIEIISPGVINPNQGPDFLDARIKIGPTTWAGSVELHLFSSGWEQHGHGQDHNFQNVVLHVVWKNDRNEGNLPLLELENRIPGVLMSRFEDLMGSSLFIPCEKMITGLDPLVIDHWKDRLMTERTERKAQQIFKLYEESNHNWQEIYWWLLARNFGYSVNADAFESLARSLGMNVLNKHKGQIQQLECLLLGQVQLLQEKFSDAYPLMLQKEYQFLKIKYQLQPSHIPVHFLRMRPANFPTIRLAQLAMLVHRDGHLLENILTVEELKALREVFDITPNDYWQTHYLPGRATSYVDKKIGNAMFENITINTIVPFLFAYGNYHGKEKFKQKAFRWLTGTPAETNTIISGFRASGIRCSNAGESQALIELKTRYCEKKRCLECNIGNAVLYHR
jgi:hypothetical protein